MAVDEVIAQIETDKVTMDVRAPAAGVIDSIKARIPNQPRLGLSGTTCASSRR